jgi:AraC family transcriptional regulator
MKQPLETFPQPHRHVLPAPIATTRGRGWGAVAADVYALADLDFVGMHREHLVSVQICGAVQLYQERDGREWQQEVRPGHVIVTPAGAPKTWRRTGSGTLLIVSIPPTHLVSVFERASGRCGAVPRLRDEFAAIDPRLAELGRLVWTELTENRLGMRIAVEAALDQLVLQVIREHCQSEPARTAPVSISPHKLRLAKAFIQENLASDLAVDAIARAVGMSAYHFAHAFRAATGVPPHRYVMQRRMERAKALLRGSELTLTDIAQRVGYSSASHFSVGFRKLTQVAPSDYRKSP